MKASDVSRFFGKTRRQGSCLIWIGGVSKGAGYGNFWLDGRRSLRGTGQRWIAEPEGVPVNRIPSGVWLADVTRVNAEGRPYVAITRLTGDYEYGPLFNGVGTLVRGDRVFVSFLGDSDDEPVIIAKEGGQVPNPHTHPYAPEVHDHPHTHPYAPEVHEHAYIPEVAQSPDGAQWRVQPSVDNAGAVTWTATKIV